MNILGISAYFHDSAAALLRDGTVAAAAQEERFSRIKHDSSFPEQAAAYCLAEGGIEASQLDQVVFYEQPYRRFERLLETWLAFAPRSFANFSQALPVWAGQRLKLASNLREKLEGFKGEVLFCTHHESHACSAFYPSPFEKAAILTLDAVGEWASSSIGVGEGQRVRMLKEIHFPHSLGMLYSAFTYYCGFRVNSGEYKLMGLAPYGTPRYKDLILDKLVSIRSDGSLWLDMSYFDFCRGTTMTSERFHGLFGGPPRPPETALSDRHMDLAASLQRVCEEVVLRAARFARDETGLRDLVMAGGVALNCVANGRLRRSGELDRIWIQPAAGDAGGALGAALWAWHNRLQRPRRAEPADSQRGSFLGPAFSNPDIGLYLDSMGAVYSDFPDEEDLLGRVAELLRDEKVVGWFQGRMEFGPRALGGRSILADARSPRMQQVLNLKIKFRESFRPFAPVVLQEHASRIFEMEEGEESPYMLFVAPVRPEWRRALSSGEAEAMQDEDLRVRVAVARSHYPAITHVDYSARVQTVDAGRHGRFHRLMSRFYELTGSPVLVNTSFNIRGEPIVCTPEDAYRCFMATDMDCLVLENHLLLKQDQPAWLTHEADHYRSSYKLD